MQAYCYVINNIMLVIRSKLFFLGNKKAALAAIKNRPETVKNDFSDYSSNSKGSCPPKARENLRSYSSTD